MLVEQILEQMISEGVDSVIYGSIYSTIKLSYLSLVVQKSGEVYV